MYQLFASVLLSVVCSWLSLFVLIPRLRRRLLDRPNARSSHCKPTPRGGGVPFVVLASVSSGIVALSGYWFTLGALPVLAAPLAFVGLLDDRYDLPASWRYGVQVLTAALMFGLSPLAQGLGPSVISAVWPSLVVFVIFVIATTAVINFINFMDGLDGLVGGCMAIAISSLSYELNAPWSLWVLVGSLRGFLFWNWSPAKLFMGDVGSTFLGAVFAGLVFQASSLPLAFVYLLVATPLLADAFSCVLRRLLAGQRVFQAHRLHLFQRLHQAGWSHARVSFAYITATALLALALLVGSYSLLYGLVVVELVLGVWFDQRVAVPFSVASDS